MDSWYGTAGPYGSPTRGPDSGRGVSHLVKHGPWLNHVMTPRSSLKSSPGVQYTRVYLTMQHPGSHCEHWCSLGYRHMAQHS